jgi:hypothetical protein
MIVYILRFFLARQRGPLNAWYLSTVPARQAIQNCQILPVDFHSHSSEHSIKQCHFLLCMLRSLKLHNGC